MTNNAAPPAAPAAQSRSLVAQPAFRLFWIGETAWGFASYATGLALPLIAVTVLNASPFVVGLLAAALWVPWLAMGLPAGAWVDRLSKRPLMITCNLVSVALLISVPVAWWLGALGIGQLLVVALLIGATTVFFTTAYHAYLPLIVSEKDIIEGNSKLQGSESTMQMLGPSMGGAISQFFGAVSGLLTNIASLLLSTFCLARIPDKEVGRSVARQRVGLRTEIREGLVFVTRDPYLRQMVIYGAVANLAIDGYEAVRIPFLIRTVGVNAAVVGILIAAGGLGGIVGAMCIRPLLERYGTARGLLVAKLVAAPFGLLMPMTGSGPGVVLFAAGLLMVDGSIVASSVALGSFRQLYCPPELLGRVIATTTFIKYSTIPVGAVLGGLLGSTIGLRPTMWIMTAALAACTAILLCKPLGHVRDFPARPEQKATTG
jgi:MFS family permease